MKALLNFIRTFISNTSSRIKTWRNKRKILSSFLSGNYLNCSHSHSTAINILNFSEKKITKSVTVRMFIGANAFLLKCSGKIFLSNSSNNVWSICNRKTVPGTIIYFMLHHQYSCWVKSRRIQRSKSSGLIYFLI